MEDTWFSRELPVLEALVQHFDDPDAAHMTVDGLAATSGLSENDVKRALLALDSEDPPLIRGVGAAQVSYPILIVGVTAEARRAVGAWPTAEALADRLLDRLSELAEHGSTPERRSRARKLLDALGGGGKDVLVEVTAAVINRQMGGS